MGNGRLPGFAAAMVLVLCCGACAGDDAGRQTALDAASERAHDGAAPAASGKADAGSTRSSTPRSRPARNDSAAPTSSQAHGRKPGSATRSRTVPEVLLAEVTDSASDADSGAPSFVELTGATVAGARGDLTLTIRVADTVPDTLPPGQVAIFAFDLRVGESDVTVVAQVDHGGTKAELSRDDGATPLEHEVAGREVSIFVPWRLLGSDRPAFDWTAATALLEVSAEGMSSRGGDSAEQSRFPLPASPSN